MKERELHLDKMPEKIPKVFLCADGFEKTSWGLHLQTKNREVGSERGLFLQVKHSNRNRVWVYDDILSHGYFVDIISVNQWTWKDKLRGSSINELVFSRGAIAMLERYDKEFDNFGQIAKSFVKDQTGNILKDNSLFLMLNELDDISRSCMHSNNLGNEVSLSKDFDFPISLFRRCMTQYFGDVFNPTPEEFIFALTMEGISGNTEWEKASIEKAKLYIEGKGH